MDPLVIVLVLGIVVVLYCGYLLIDACRNIMKAGMKDSAQAIRAGMMMPDQHLSETTVDDSYESHESEDEETIDNALIKSS